jgi:hypothetical protein
MQYIPLFSAGNSPFLMMKTFHLPVKLLESPLSFSNISENNLYKFHVESPCFLKKGHLGELHRPFSPACRCVKAMSQTRSSRFPTGSWWAVARSYCQGKASCVGKALENDFWLG